jgi:NitT/TauT family transport system substrate-binding protein
VRKFVKTILAAGIFLQATAGARAAELTVVNVGVTGRPDQAQLELARARGYFQKQGIDVHFVPGGTSGQDYISSLATNQIQVAAGSPNAGMFNAVNRGIDVRIVADWAHLGESDDSTFSFVVRKDLLDSGEIKTPADLKGKPIGVGPQFGAYNEMFIYKMLKGAGLGMSDIEPEFINFPDGLAAMGSKKIVGTLMIEPLVLIAHERKVAEVLMPASKIDPGAQVAVVLYSPQFADNTELATRYMVAYLQGVRDMLNAYVKRIDTDATTDILIETLSIKDRHVWEAMSPHVVDPDGRINVKHIQEQAEFYKMRDEVSGPVPDVAKLVDTRFAEAAVKILGKY